MYMGGGVAFAWDVSNVVMDFKKFVGALNKQYFPC